MNSACPSPLGWYITSDTNQIKLRIGGSAHVSFLVYQLGLVIGEQHRFSQAGKVARRKLPGQSAPHHPWGWQPLRETRSRRG